MKTRTNKNKSYLLQKAIKKTTTIISIRCPECFLFWGVTGIEYNKTNILNNRFKVEDSVDDTNTEIQEEIYESSDEETDITEDVETDLENIQEETHEETQEETQEENNVKIRVTNHFLETMK